MPLKLTFALMLLCFTSVTGLRLVLSLNALNLGADPLAVALLSVTFYGFPFVLAWPVGIWSDRIDSRWLLLLGTICGTLAVLFPYFAQDLPAIYAAGAMLGLSFAFYNVLLQNLVGLLSEPNELARNFANASMLGAASSFLGPFLGGLAIDHAGNAEACLFMGAPAFIAAVLLALFGGILPGATRSAPRTSGRDGLIRGPIVKTLIASALVQLGQDTYQVYVPIYGHAIGLSGSAIGGVLAIFAAAAFAMRFLMPRLVVLLGEERLLSYSLYGTAIGYALAPWVPHFAALAAVSIVVGAGLGCGQPITTMLVFNQSSKGRSGETLGFRQAVNSAVRMSGPAAFGVMATMSGLLSVFLVNAVIMGIGGWVARGIGKSDAK
jgi:MFS family permease